MAKIKKVWIPILISSGTMSNNDGMKKIRRDFLCRKYRDL
ncbi:hypothetical protein CBN_0186 [Clostridium botulinum NCTC 2916]|nr:hypothetical protein CBN_0186 [Clostridium botulinum NCTC 2916]